VLICNRVAGFIIVGGQDNIQMVAGRMLGFFAELGYLSAVPVYRSFARLVARGHGEQRRDGAKLEGTRRWRVHAREALARSCGAPEQDEAPASIERGAARPIRCRWEAAREKRTSGPDLAGAKPADE
jgi:hypothetical protein